MEDYQFGHCRVEEIPELVALTNRVFRPGATGDMGREYPILFDPGNAVNLRVAWCGGRVVSHVGISIREAAIMGARLRVASIGAVATDPEHRGRELASRLMEDARRRALEEGCSLMLISGGRGSTTAWDTWRSAASWRSPFRQEPPPASGRCGPPGKGTSPP